MVSHRSMLMIAAAASIAVANRGDGVALNAAPHPVGPPVPDDADINSGSTVMSEISLTRYAAAGEKVTCENGHVICEFLVDVAIGGTQDLANQLGNWTQDAPVVGQIPIPGCATCGAAFTDGSVFHFEDGWRRPRGFGLSPKVGFMPVPDRCAIDPASPYYRADYERIGVRFDGAPITNCAEYCVSEGWIKALVSDGRGNWIKERGKPRTIRKPGKVEPYWKG